MTITLDPAMDHMNAISDGMSTVEQLADVFLTCAALDLHPDTSTNPRPTSQLSGVLDSSLMPTAKDFAAVYLATGRTEADRLERWGQVSTSFCPSAATESAWCRSMLKRAALLQATERKS